MSAPLITGEVKGAQALESAVQDYRALIKDDAGKTLVKLARVAAISANKIFRLASPRKGTISAAARARGYRLNPTSKSYLTGEASARTILGTAKSGLFKINEKDGVTTATPLILGARGRLQAAGSKAKGGSVLISRAQLAPQRTRDLVAYRRLLTQAKRTASFEARRARVRGYLDTNQIPAGAVRLNRGSLAAIRAMALREKAARGGYLAAQFLTARRMKSSGETQFFTKDKILAGAIDISTDQEGAAFRAQIAGYLPGSAKIAIRDGVIPKVLDLAAKTFRADMIERINRRAAQKFGKVAK